MTERLNTRTHPQTQDTPKYKGEALFRAILRFKNILYGKSPYDHGISHQSWWRTSPKRPGNKSHPIVFSLHRFKGWIPDIYFSNCSESVYVVLQVDFRRLIAYFEQFGCLHLPHRPLRRSWVIGALRQTLFWAADGPDLVLKEPSEPARS